jgi:hypothetical protein
MWKTFCSPKLPVEHKFCQNTSTLKFRLNFPYLTVIFQLKKYLKTMLTIHRVLRRMTHNNTMWMSMRGKKASTLVANQKKNPLKSSNHGPNN